MWHPNKWSAQRNNQDLVSLFLLNYKTCNIPMIPEPAEKDNFALTQVSFISGRLLNILSLLAIWEKNSRD